MPTWKAHETIKYHIRLYYLCLDKYGTWVFLRVLYFVEIILLMQKKILLGKNSSKRSSVHCWCNLVAVRAASFDDKKFLIFQGGQWFVDQLWERWNQWVKNGSQWSSNYNLSSLEINGPSPLAKEEFFSPSSSKQENCWERPTNYSCVSKFVAKLDF